MLGKFPLKPIIANKPYIPPTNSETLVCSQGKREMVLNVLAKIPNVLITEFHNHESKTHLRNFQ